jgi:hypothetical protein
LSWILSPLLFLRLLLQELMIFVKGVAGLSSQCVTKFQYSWRKNNKIKIVHEGHPIETFDALDAYFNCLIMVNQYEVLK